MMMMKKTNTPKSSTSKLSNNGRRDRQQQQQKGSPRSPLKVKDLNISTSYSSSSTATSISSDAPPKGCSRFLLSNHHHHSSSSKNACFRQKSVVSKTPKSAPTVKNFRGNSSDGIKKSNNLQNPQKPTSRIVQKLRRKPPTSSRSGLSNHLSFGLSSKSDLSNGLPYGSGIELHDNATNVTPVTKLASVCDLDGSVRQERGVKLEEKGETNDQDGNGQSTPPVEPSVSPEIQGGSASVVVATPTTCYAAGHVLSGVTDRRKCRPKGLLTVGNKLLFGSSQAKVCDNVDENVTGDGNRRRDSMVATPIKASIHWISSPLHESSSEGKQDQDGSGVRLSSGGMLMPLDSVGCSSSPASSFGFSSEVFNKSDSTITASDGTIASHSGRKGGSFMDLDSNSEFRGLFGPSLEYLVCSPTPASPTCMPSCGNEDRYANAGETTPWMEDSVGSENVIRTPQSNSRSPQFGSPRLSRDEISKLWFEYEPDSVAELIQRVSLSPEQQQPLLMGSPNMSFEFSPLIKPACSTEFALFEKAVDNQAFTGNTESVVHNFGAPESSISWKEELSSHMFETDELDCCRCFSDDGGDSCSKFSPLGSDKNSANKKGDQIFHSEWH